MHDFFLQNRDFSSSKESDKTRINMKGAVSKQEDKKIRDMLMYYTQQDVREPLDGENRKLIDGITTF
jgi:hypothetical protein